MLIFNTLLRADNETKSVITIYTARSIKSDKKGKGLDSKEI